MKLKFRQVYIYVLYIVLHLYAALNNSKAYIHLSTLLPATDARNYYQGIKIIFRPIVKYK